MSNLEIRHLASQGIEEPRSEDSLQVLKREPKAGGHTQSGGQDRFSLCSQNTSLESQATVANSGVLALFKKPAPKKIDNTTYEKANQALERYAELVDSKADETIVGDFFGANLVDYPERYQARDIVINFLRNPSAKDKDKKALYTAFYDEKISYEEHWYFEDELFPNMAVPNWAWETLTEQIGQEQNMPDKIFLLGCFLQDKTTIDGKPLPKKELSNGQYEKLISLVEALWVQASDHERIFLLGILVGGQKAGRKHPKLVTFIQEKFSAKDGQLPEVATVLIQGLSASQPKQENALSYLLPPEKFWVEDIFIAWFDQSQAGDKVNFFKFLEDTLIHTQDPKAAHRLLIMLHSRAKEKEISEQLNKLHVERAIPWEARRDSVIEVVDKTSDWTLASSLINSTLPKEQVKREEVYEGLVWPPTRKMDMLHGGMGGLFDIFDSIRDADLQKANDLAVLSIAYAHYHYGSYDYDKDQPKANRWETTVGKFKGVSREVWERGKNSPYPELASFSEKMLLIKPI